jgi:hypothetical protein
VTLDRRLALLAALAHNRGELDQEALRRLLAELRAAGER